MEKCKGTEHNFKPMGIGKVVFLWGGIRYEKPVIRCTKCGSNKTIVIQEKEKLLK